jgi:hypothetical protein
MFLTVNSYKGDPFSLIKNAYMRVVDLSQNKRELVRFQLNGTGSMEHTALLMVKIYRAREYSADGTAASGVSKRWMIKGLGVGGIGRMYKDNVKDCQSELSGQLRRAAGTGFQYQPAAAPASVPAPAGLGASAAPAPAPVPAHAGSGAGKGAGAAPAAAANVDKPAEGVRCLASALHHCAASLNDVCAWFALCSVVPLCKEKNSLF